MSRPRAATSVATTSSARPLAKGAHEPLALRLVHVAMDGGDGVAARVQSLRQLVYVALRPAEDDRRGRRLKVENARERLDLRALRRPHEELARLRRRAGLLPDGDALRVALVLLRQRLYPARDGCGKERDLPLLRHLVEDELDVLHEAHIQHLVRLVEHDRTDGREVEGPAADVVHDAAWSPDDDLGAGAQASELPVVGLAAVHREHRQAARAPEAVHRLRHLHGELARRGEHQRLHRSPLRVDALG